MPPSEQLSLWHAAVSLGNLIARSVCGANATFVLAGLERGSILSGHLEEFRGKSVLVAMEDQAVAAVALLELDGIARRMVLYPSDVSLEHARLVAADAEVDAVVSDYRDGKIAAIPAPLTVTCGSSIEGAAPDRTANHRTEWILLTSATTGRPKMVTHTLRSLTGAIGGGAPAEPIVWSTFYDIRRYGGLQIFLRAMLCGATLVLSGARESTGHFLTRAGFAGVTHISGTPSHWRRALMTEFARRIEPRYVRLSGEIADQAILDNLKAFYPKANVAHAFATTEAGVAFEVRDGLAGFPANFIGQSNGVEMKVEDRSLRIRSDRMATAYLGPESPALAGADGFIDTGDLLELRDGRYLFAGRRDGVVNVGGRKVHPEEVEAIINRHPYVRMSYVRTRKSPVTGALVVADVVLQTVEEKDKRASRRIETEILQLCRESLQPHKVPAAIRFVPSLAIGASGKLERRNA